MKNKRLLLNLIAILLAAQILFPSLSAADDADPVISVPEELGGGYLISAGRAVGAGLVTVADSAAAAGAHTLTVVIAGTGGAVKSSPKGIHCTHSTGAAPTACRLPFTARGITLHAETPAIIPDIICAQNNGGDASLCDVRYTAKGKAVKDTASAILDWAAVTAGGAPDISGRCKHESPTCSFNLTEDMTVTATFGVDAVAKVTPQTTALKPFDFGKVKDGKSKAATVTVRNTGVTRLTISAIDVDASGSPFTVPATLSGKPADKCTGAQLDPGKNCTFKVVFTPTGASSTPFTATIAVTSDDAESPDYFHVQGTGYGVVKPDIICRGAGVPGIDRAGRCSGY